MTYCWYALPGLTPCSRLANGVTPLGLRQWSTRSTLQKQRPHKRIDCSTAQSRFSDAIPQQPSTSLGRRIWYTIRAFSFAVTATTISIPLFAVMLLAMPFVFLFDRHRRLFYARVNAIWARFSSLFFYDVKIEGRQNLPAATQASVYVANHQSYLDIFAMLLLNRPIRFISKTSVFFIPIIGWSMFLTGHVGLNRADRRSQIKCLRDCQKLLKNGSSIMLFPEGTRSPDQEIRTFKKGAFSLAVSTGAPIVPITIRGTGDLMPKGKEHELRSGTFRVIVHPTIDSKGENPNTLRQQTQTVVASRLSN